MTIQSGTLVVLKIGDGAGPEGFATIGGLLITGFQQRNKSVDITTRDSAGWRTLLDDAGVRSVFIAGAGRFADSAAEEILRSAAMGNRIKNYQIAFGNGDMLSGAFQIISYKRNGNHKTEETYVVSLASAGPVGFATA